MKVKINKEGMDFETGEKKWTWKGYTVIGVAISLVGILVYAIIRPRQAARAFAFLWQEAEHARESFRLWWINTRPRRIAAANWVSQRLATLGNWLRWIGIVYGSLTVFVLILYLWGNPAACYLGFFILFCMAYVPYFLALLFNNRLFGWLARPIAMYTAYAMVLAIAMLTFNSGAGVPWQTRAAWGAAVLIWPMAYAIMGKRGTVGPALFAAIAILVMAMQLATPISTRLGQAYTWKSNVGWSKEGATIYFWGEKDGRRTFTAKVLPRGTQLNVRDKGAVVESLREYAWENYWSEPSSLRGTMVVNEKVQGVMPGTYIWQPGLFQFIFHLYWPWLRPHPPADAMPRGGIVGHFSEARIAMADDGDSSPTVSFVGADGRYDVPADGEFYPLKDARGMGLKYPQAGSLILKAKALTAGRAPYLCQFAGPNGQFPGNWFDLDIGTFYNIEVSEPNRNQAVEVRIVRKGVR